MNRIKCIIPYLIILCFIFQQPVRSDSSAAGSLPAETQHIETFPAGSLPADSLQCGSLPADSLPVTHRPADSLPIGTPEVNLSLITEDTISIAGVGDIMLGTDFPGKEYLPPGNNCDFLMEGVYEVLRTADVSFGNLEGVFSDTATVKKKCNNPQACYAFRTPTSYFSCIEKAGFDLLSLANNHIFDLGHYGVEATLELIDSAGMKHAGLDSLPYSILRKAGHLIGFCAFSPNKGTCQITNLDRATRIVDTLDKTCDVVVVSFHGGAEGADFQHVTRDTEIFYNENRGNVYEFAHAVIDAGADVVFGHGPHVLRGMEIYKDRFIAYSLGNFATYKRIKISGVNGISAIVKILVTSSGKFTGGEIIPVHQTRERGTRVDELDRAVQMLQELTREDFPKNSIEITDQGFIYNNGLNKVN